MTDSRPIARSKSLGWRLLLAFASLLVVVVLANLLVVQQMREKERQVSLALDEKVPALLSMQAVVSDSARLKALLESSLQPDSLQELEAEREAARRVVLDLSLAFDGLAKRDPNSSSIAAVRAEVEGLQGLLERSCALGVRLLEEASRVQTATSEALEFSQSARLAIDLAKLSSGAGATRDGLNSSVRSLEALALRVPRSADQAQLGRIREEFQLAEREANSVLVRISDSGERRALAQPTLQLVEALAGPDGAFKGQASLLATSEEALRLRAEADGLVQGLEAQVGALSEAARLAVVSASEAARSSTQLLRTSIFVTLALIVLWTLAVMLFYVRRRLLRRLSALHEAIGEVSRGGLDRAVRVDGEDEIAEVAAAAEILRRKALDLNTARDQLRSRNAALMEFTSVASHDLKAPLRAISNLSGWLLEDAPADTPEETRESLEEIQSRARRMQALLEGLLQYARLGREGVPPEHLDTAEVFREAAEAVVLPEAFSLTIAPDLPVLRTQRAPFEMVARNLLQNAVAHHDRERGHISVSAERPDLRLPAITFRVADDGPGIPADQRERAFALFRSLGPADAPGTGLGLALVRRAAEGSGGSVRIFANEPRGTVIAFTWVPAES